MIVKRVAFGNFVEAFIENNIFSGVNIIYSNDNNKGKTLLIQGLMYALGNDPIFPSGFDFHNYYYYASIEINKMTYEFLRKNKTIILKSEKYYQIFESMSELKYWVNDNLFKLPIIIKNNEEKIVDLYLFFQLFFIGQDKRNTSNILKSGQYNKADFLNMLSYINGSYQTFKDDIDIEEIRNKIKDKKTDINYLSKQMKFVKDNPKIASHAISTIDKESHEKYKKQLNEVNDNISKYKSQRLRETNRVTKLEYLLTELNSLNRNIEIGKVKCAECGSDRVIYSNGDISFEITNPIVKKKIIDSINEQIKMKNDIIQELSEEINIEQTRQKEILMTVPQKMQQILAFSDEILSDDEYNQKIVTLQSQIQELEEKISADRELDANIKDKNNLMLESIISKMNSLYHEIDPEGNLKFNKLFTINDENYSGSEEQEFYFCKLLSINDYFKHEFPIIIDSFRSGELSTKKELAMLNLYKKLNKQIFLTSTLKDEEYEKLKYDSDKQINAIDYSNHKNSKILQEGYSKEFKIILESFDIVENT